MYQIEENQLIIKTLFVGKRKFTKALFNQIIDKSPLNKDLKFMGESYFGFINIDDTRYLIWKNIDELFKYDLKDVIELSEVYWKKPLDYKMRNALNAFDFKPNNEIEGSKFTYLGLSPEEEDRLITLSADALELIMQLRGKQIFL